jgi:hypothetical protein
MYKWNDFLTKLAQTNVIVSSVHKTLIKQKFLDILYRNYNKLIPINCRIVLAKINPTDPNSKNSLFVSMGNKNRTSSETEVPELVENELNDFFHKSDMAYIFNPTTEKFIINIPEQEVLTKGVRGQKKQDQ